MIPQLGKPVYKSLAPAKGRLCGYSVSRYKEKRIFLLPMVVGALQIIALIFPISSVPQASLATQLAIMSSYIGFFGVLASFPLRLPVMTADTLPQPSRRENLIALSVMTIIIWFQLIPALRYTEQLLTMGLGEVRDLSLRGGFLLKEGLYGDSFTYLISKFVASELGYLVVCYYLLSHYKYRRWVIACTSAIAIYSSLVTGGRGAAYYYAIMLVTYYLMKGRRVNRVMWTLSAMAVGLTIFSLLVVSVRADSNLTITGHMLSVLQYHTISSQYLALFADYVLSGHASSDEFLGKADGGFTFGSLLAPIAFILGERGDNVPVFQLWTALDHFTIWDREQSRSYNAFGTLFSPLVLDFGMFVPIASALYAALLLMIVRMLPARLRAVVALWLSVSIYISLFGPQLNSVFSLAVLFGALVYGVLRKVGAAHI